MFDSGLRLYLTFVRHEIIVECLHFAEVKSLRYTLIIKSKVREPRFYYFWKYTFPVPLVGNYFQYVFHYSY